MNKMPEPEQLQFSPNEQERADTFLRQALLAMSTSAPDDDIYSPELNMLLSNGYQLRVQEVFDTPIAGHLTVCGHPNNRHESQQEIYRKITGILGLVAQARGRIKYIQCINLANQAPKKGDRILELEPNNPKRIAHVRKRAIKIVLLPPDEDVQDIHPPEDVKPLTEQDTFVGRVVGVEGLDQER